MLNRKCVSANFHLFQWGQFLRVSPLISFSVNFIVSHNITFHGKPINPTHNSTQFLGISRTRKTKHAQAGLQALVQALWQRCTQWQIWRWSWKRKHTDFAFLYFADPLQLKAAMGLSTSPSPPPLPSPCSGKLQPPTLTHIVSDFSFSLLVFAKIPTRKHNSQPCQPPRHRQHSQQVSAWTS